MSICALVLVFSLLRACNSLDFIAPGQTLPDGSTLVSAEGTFELGFFSPGKSQNRYLGVWYKNITPVTVVWVANRETPLYDRGGVLNLNDHGVLMILNSTNKIVWFSNSSNSSRTTQKPIVQLLDTGNLVVRLRGEIDNVDDEQFIWQGFDFPSDTLLPGMKFGWNLVKGLNRFISSWRSPEDPGKGEHVLQIDPRGYPQSVQLKGSVTQFRAGHWNGLYLTGFPVQKQNPIYKSEFLFDEKEVYYRFELMDRSILSRIILNPSGIGQRFVWRRGQKRGWEIISANLVDQCDNYALCGVYSICNFSSNRVCSCLKGFVPKNEQEWNVSFWSNGCVRGSALDCDGKDGFKKYTDMKLPDTSFSRFNKTMSLEECRKTCLKNCSCTAYANLDIRDGGSGCLLWFHDLIDMRQLHHGGQDLYIRVSASETGALVFLPFLFVFLPLLYALNIGLIRRKFLIHGGGFKHWKMRNSKMKPEVLWNCYLHFDMPMHVLINIV